VSSIDAVEITQAPRLSIRWGGSLTFFDNDLLWAYGNNSGYLTATARRIA
jgi:hypothetical protein